MTSGPLSGERKRHSLENDAGQVIGYSSESNLRLAARLTGLNSNALHKAFFVSGYTFGLYAFRVMAKASEDKSMLYRDSTGGCFMVAANSGTKAIGDLEYDLIAVLKNKSEAVQLYDTYIQDAQQAGSQPCVELLQRLQQDDRQHVEEIRRHVQEVMQKGKM